MNFHESLGHRIWSMAHPHANENELWQMRLWITKARESASHELRLKFSARFHEVAVAVLERSGFCVHC